MADPAPAHVLVLYESSRRGAAALEQAADLAARSGSRLTVVVAAVLESEDPGCCDTRAGYWNGVVRELAAADLGRARTLLRAGTAADFRVVTARSIPLALAGEAERCGADLVLVPSARGIRRSRRARQVQRRVRGAVVVAGMTR